MDPLLGWPHDGPAFHAGERAAQARAGVQERMAQVGRRAVRGAMPDQHRELFEKLPFLLLGALDREQRPWAAVLAGGAGFVRTPDARTLAIDARPLGERAAGLQLDPGAAVALLGLEPATRRRNRANGRVAADTGSGLVVQVQQSFGNCPKYIQARGLERVRPAPAPAQAFSARLPDSARALVHRADTFFVATASDDAGQRGRHENGGVDVSHRGGKPGFVRVDEADGRSVLTAPDFVGNFFFNTLGNIASNPRAGLLFIDWADGDLLMLTGRAEAMWDGAELHAFAGAQRLLRFTLDEGRRLPGAMPLRGVGVDYAPQLAGTGAWPASTDAAR